MKLAHIIFTTHKKLKQQHRAPKDYLIELQHDTSEEASSTGKEVATYGDPWEEADNNHCNQRWQPILRISHSKQRPLHRLHS